MGRVSDGATRGRGDAQGDDTRRPRRDAATRRSGDTSARRPVHPCCDRPSGPERCILNKSMKHGEKIAPLVALTAAVSSLACCLPLAFAAALGSAGLGVAFAVARPWLLGLSFVFLAVGF